MTGTHHDAQQPDALDPDERRRLLHVAYRLLGSVTEAEDAVQEAYSRWLALPVSKRAAVDSPGAWLTTVTSRICLDVRKSARSRRERYVGEWLPEPVPDDWSAGGGTAVDPADRVTMDESVTMAFLVVLEVLTPAERVAFVLHDVFGYPFTQIAAIVGRTPHACRQLSSRARARIRDAGAELPRRTQHSDVVHRFKRAWDDHDIEGIIEVLDPRVVARADGGGVVVAHLEPVEGAAEVARVMLSIRDAVPDMTLLERTVNAGPGLVAHTGDVVEAVFAFEVSAGRISRIWAVRNPDKLSLWTTA